jgi:hypothetical protein
MAACFPEAFGVVLGSERGEKMMWNTIGEKAHTTSILVAVVCIAVLMLTLGVPTAAARGTTGPSTAGMGAHTIVVKPNGLDDTANLQAAFNTCTSHGWTCTIQLVKGTYYTSQITAFGFQGSFVGAGQGQTTLQALPNLPSPNPAYNTPTTFFWSHPPSLSNPWPVLITFLNGTIHVAGLTITEPYNLPVPGGYYGPLGLWYALYGTIWFTGTHASASVDRVSIQGTPPVSPLPTNGVYTGVAYLGETELPGDSNPADFLFQTGAFSVTDSSFSQMSYGTDTETLLGARATICSNTYDDNYVAHFAGDLSNSNLVFCSNQVTNVIGGAGFYAIAGNLKSSLAPASFEVLNNLIGAGEGANGIGFSDFLTPSSINAVVAGNTIQTDSSCGCYDPTSPYFAAIYSYDARSLLVAGNQLAGGVSPGIYVAGGPAVVVRNQVPGTYVGVWVDYAGDVSVAGNVVQYSTAVGIAVTDGSSHDLIAGNLVTGSSLFDLYWDQTGTGDHWVGNHYATSSPSMLP